MCQFACLKRLIEARRKPRLTILDKNNQGRKLGVGRVAGTLAAVNPWCQRCLAPWHFKPEITPETEFIRWRAKYFFLNKKLRHVRFPSFCVCCHPKSKSCLAFINKLLLVKCIGDVLVHSQYAQIVQSVLTHCRPHIIL